MYHEKLRSWRFQICICFLYALSIDNINRFTMSRYINHTFCGTPCIWIITMVFDEFEFALTGSQLKPHFHIGIPWASWYIWRVMLSKILTTYESNVIKNTYNLHITLRAYSLLFSCCPGQHSCDICVSHILASAVAWGTDCSVGSKCDNSITICRYSIVKCSTLPSILWRKKSQRWEK